MSQLGRQVSYGIGKESTPGTAVSATNWLNQLKFELNPNVEYVNNESAYGVLEKTNDSVPLRQHAEGTLEAKLTPDTGGLILLGAFGNVSTADNPDTNPIVKDHTFTINQSVTGQSFTLIRKDTLSTEAYALTRFGEWKLSMDLGKYISFTSKVMSKIGTTTTATPAYTDETEFIAKHMTVKTASLESGLGAATAISSVESFTVTVDPNIEADWQAGSSDPYSFTSKGYEIKFEMTCRYNDLTFQNAYRNGTKLALQISAVNSDVTIGASAHPGLVISCPKMYITDWARSEDLNAPMTQKMTGTIHYSVADSRAIRAVLTNSTPSY